MARAQNTAGHPLRRAFAGLTLVQRADIAVVAIVIRVATIRNIRMIANSFCTLIRSTDIAVTAIGVIRALQAVA